MKPTPTQRAHFARSLLEHSAGIHEKMAAMQLAAGNGRLAADSRQAAQARRISAANITDGSGMDLKEALDFGEWAVKQFPA